MALPVTDVTLPAVLHGVRNGDLDAAILVSTPGLGGGPVVRLVAPAARAWRALSAAALKAGITLRASSAADSYRTLQQQIDTFKARYTTTKINGPEPRRWKNRNWYQRPETAVAAVPGTSNHGLGLAVDVDNAAGARLEWLLAHAATYGWSWETQSEAWHIRYCPGDAIPAAVVAYEEDDVSFADAVPIFKVDEAGIAQQTGTMDAAHVLGFTNAAAWASLGAANDIRKELVMLRGAIDHLTAAVTAWREAAERETAEREAERRVFAARSADADPANPADPVDAADAADAAAVTPPAE